MQFAAFSLLLIKEQTPIIKSVFLVCTDVFLFCFAVNLVYTSTVTLQSSHYSQLISRDTSNKLLVEVTDLPVEKERFIKCELNITGVKQRSSLKNTTGKIFGYFKKSEAARNIQAGKVLLVNCELLDIEPPKNPYEFDYKNYMANQQLYHIAFIDSESFVVTDLAPHFSFIRLAGLKIKQQVLYSLKNSGLNPEAYAISAALLTGYDDDIDTSTMEAFSHSGTLHVLSVSGLHTGLIYLVLSFLFDIFDRRKKQKLLKFIFITLCLWFFALLTGFSAPVLRAVIMFNLLGIGKIFFRNDYRNQINILLVSAFMLLCYDPFLIYNIGFQLSYFAMFGILFFQPVFLKLWQPEGKISTYIWQSFCASFAATVTTLPFTLFYFKQFPLWFFICNLLVVPGTFVVLLLAVLIVLKFTQAAIAVNYIIKFLTAFINLFNVAGPGYIDNIHFELTDALLLSCLVFLLSCAFYYRSFRYAVYSLLVVIFLQLNGIVVAYVTKSESLFSVYHINRKSAWSVKNTHYVTTDSIAASDYNYHVKPHMISFNYPVIENRKINYIKSGAEEIVRLDKKDCWPRCNYQTITTLVVSNNFRIKEEDLSAFKNIKTLVADGSNSFYAIERLKSLCSKNGIRFYSTRALGAYLRHL